MAPPAMGGLYFGASAGVTVHSSAFNATARAAPTAIAGDAPFIERLRGAGLIRI
jgi:hypothetical protein